MGAISSTIDKPGWDVWTDERDGVMGVQAEAGVDRDDTHTELSYGQWTM